MSEAIEIKVNSDGNLVPPVGAGGRGASGADSAGADPLEVLAAAEFRQHRAVMAYRRSMVPGAKGTPINVGNLGITDPIDTDSLTQLLCPAVNGDKDSEQQGVHIQWLSDDQRLLLPSYIGERAAASPTFVNAKREFDSAVFIATLTDTRYAEVIAKLAAPRTSWTDAERANIPLFSDAQIRGLRRVVQSVFVDRRDSSSVRLRPSVAEQPTPEEVEELRVVIMVPVTRVIGAATLTLLPVPLGSDRDYVASRFSALTMLNADPRDHALLSADEMRLADAACQTARDLPVERMRSKLRPYTVSCIAALNYTRVGSVAILAWTRGYLTSAGVLAAPESLSNSEVAYTQDLPSKAALKVLSDYHNTDPNRILLAAYSIGGAFGFQHLARDHTYKQNDAVMARVNEAYEKALATVLTKEDIDAITTKKHELHRLTCHPFGLSQCYALGQWGARHSRIAEAIAVRCNVNPPTLARLGLVVGVFEEACALPVGRILRNIYGHAHATAVQYLKAVEKEKTAYSALYRLYGWKGQLKVPEETMNTINTLMPMLAGYAAAFHEIDPETQAQRPTGAALAASLKNTRRDNMALVQLFKGLFTKYVDRAKEGGLEAFLAHQQEAITVAMQAQGGAQGQLLVGTQ